MSIKVMTRVWEHSKQTSSKLLALLAIADHADNDGVAWPGIPTVAKKARVVPRQAKRIVSDLQESGEVYIETGGGRGHANLYFVAIGLDAQQIQAVLMTRFELSSKEAQPIAQAMLEAQKKGVTDVTLSENEEEDEEEEKGDIQGQKGDIQGQKGDMAIAPESMNQGTVNMPQSGENGKADNFELPSAEVQAGILFGGRTNGNGHLDMQGAEMRLLRSGWNIRGKEIKDACMCLLVVTDWDVPAGDSARRDWHNGLKEHLEFGVANLPDYYTEAYRRLKAARQNNPDFSIPPRPQTFSKVMGAIREERKSMQGQFVEQDGKRYRIVK